MQRTHKERKRERERGEKEKEKEKERITEDAELLLTVKGLLKRCNYGRFGNAVQSTDFSRCVGIVILHVEVYHSNRNQSDEQKR